MIKMYKDGGEWVYYERYIQNQKKNLLWVNLSNCKI